MLVANTFFNTSVQMLPAPVMTVHQSDLAQLHQDIKSKDFKN